MKTLRSLVLVVGLVLVAAAGCDGDDGGDDAQKEGAGSTGTLTAPTDLAIKTVDGKPHLTWKDGKNEDHYMIERMNHAANTEFTAVKGAENLVTNTTQFHDSSAVAGTAYMYRVVGMKGQTRAESNQVTWP